MLAKRLARHGFVVSGGSLAGLLSQGAASASAPASAVVSTIKSASVLTAGGALAANVAALTEGVVKAMFINKLKSVGGILVVILGFSLGTVALSRVFAQGDGKRLDAAAVNERYVQTKNKGDAEAPKKAAPKTDEEKLQGVWKLVRMEMGGQVVSEEETSLFPELVFDGKRIENDKRKQPVPFPRGAFTLDTTKNPRKITIIT